MPLVTHQELKYPHACNNIHFTSRGTGIGGACQLGRDNVRLKDIYVVMSIMGNEITYYRNNEDGIINTMDT